MPVVTVVRDSGYADRIRDYIVLIDGAEAGRVSNGQTLTLDVPAGKHTVQARIDWMRTQELRFTAGDAPAAFRVRSKLRGWKVLLASVLAFIPGQWIDIERA